MGALRYLWQQVRGMGTPVPAMAAALGARIGLTLASPWLVGRFLDGVERHQPLSHLEPWAVLFLAAALLSPAAAYATGSLALAVEWTVANRLRERLASIVLALPLQRHRAMTPGEVVERLDGDVSALGALLSNLGLQVVGSTGQALAALVGLLVMNRALGLLLAGLAALVTWLLAWFRRRTVPLVQAERQANADTYGLLGERVAAEGATGYALARLTGEQRQRRPQYVRAELSGYLAWALTLGAFGLADGTAYWVSGRLPLGTHLPLGTVYVLVAYVGLLTAPLSSLREQVQELQCSQGPPPGHDLGPAAGWAAAGNPYVAPWPPPGGGVGGQLAPRWHPGGPRPLVYAGAWPPPGGGGAQRCRQLDAGRLARAFD